MKTFKPPQSKLAQVLTMRAMREQMKSATDIPKIPKKHQSFRMPSIPKVKY